MGCRDLFRVVIIVVLAATAARLAAPRSAWSEAEIAVDIELVLAIDVSGSIDPEEAKLQRQGYVTALTHPKIVESYCQKLCMG